MAISEKYHFEELDDPSREYLLLIRERRGRGMPGVYVPSSNFMPGLGCFFGIAILIAFAIIAANQMTQEPLAVAMLETAGLLLGGWMIIAAIRVWSASKSSRYIGHFVFSDSETLWECSGSYVTATDIYHLIEARGVQNYNEGKYQNTAVTVQTSNGSKYLTLKDEERGRQLIVFLNMVAWMRSGGDGNPGVDAGTGEEFSFKKLPPAIMGGLAKELAQTGEMPRSFTADSLELEVTDVPTPKKEGRASSSMLSYLIIIAIGIASVFFFRELNVGWRDAEIWDNITQITDQDKRAPWLRAYLNDPRNKKHRDDAKRMLLKIYEDNIARMKNAPVNPVGFIPGGFGMGGVNAPVDKDLLDGYAEVLRSIAELPQPIISVSVKENGNALNKDGREKQVREKYSLKLYEGIGKELAIFAEAPANTDGLIDISYEVVRRGVQKEPLIRPFADNSAYEVRFTVKYRKTPDNDPVKTVKYTVGASSDSPDAVGQAAQDLGSRTAGSKKPEPPPLPIDF